MNLVRRLLGLVAFVVIFEPAHSQYSDGLLWGRNENFGWPGKTGFGNEGEGIPSELLKLQIGPTQPHTNPGDLYIVGQILIAFAAFTQAFLNSTVPAHTALEGATHNIFFVQTDGKLFMWNKLSGTILLILPDDRLKEMANAYRAKKANGINYPVHVYFDEIIGINNAQISSQAVNFVEMIFGELMKYWGSENGAQFLFNLNGILPYRQIYTGTSFTLNYKNSPLRELIYTQNIDILLKQIVAQSRICDFLRSVTVNPNISKGDNAQNQGQERSGSPKEWENLRGSLGNPPNGSPNRPPNGPPNELPGRSPNRLPDGYPNEFPNGPLQGSSGGRLHNPLSGPPNGPPDGYPNEFPNGSPQGSSGGRPHNPSSGPPNGPPDGYPNEFPNGSPQGSSGGRPHNPSSGLPNRPPDGYPNEFPNGPPQGLSGGPPNRPPDGYPNEFPNGHSQGPEVGPPDGSVSSKFPPNKYPQEPSNKNQQFIPPPNAGQFGHSRFPDPRGLPYGKPLSTPDTQLGFSEYIDDNFNENSKQNNGKQESNNKNNKSPPESENISVNYEFIFGLIEYVKDLSGAIDSLFGHLRIGLNRKYINPLIEHSLTVDGLASVPLKEIGLNLIADFISLIFPVDEEKQNREPSRGTGTKEKESNARARDSSISFPRDPGSEKFGRQLKWR